MARMNKYGNHKVLFDAVQFDSKAEARRYKELKELEAIGTIKNLILQPRFELQPAFKKHNKTHRKIEYIADFQYEDYKGNIIVEDVKGMETDVFKLKMKMFEYKYKDLNLRLITKRRF